MIPSYDEVMNDNPKKKIPSYDEVMGESAPIKKKEPLDQVAAGLQRLSSFFGISPQASSADTKSKIIDATPPKEILDPKTGLKYFDIPQKQEDKPSGEIPYFTTDPIKQLVSPLREKATKINEEYNQTGLKSRQISESTNQTGTGNKGDIKAKFETEINNLNDQVDHVATTAINTLFPNGKVAKQYIEDFYNKNGDLPQGNETLNIAAGKAIQYENLKNKVSEGRDLRQLAVDLHRENDPNFDKQISVIEKENTWDKFTGLYENYVPEEVQGRDVDELIHNPDIQLIAEENPKVKAQLDQLKDGKIYNVYPKYGEIVARNELSRLRQQVGKNNMVANFMFDKSKYMDKLAEETFKDNPELLKNYNERLKGNLSGKIDTPDFLSRFAEGGKETFQGMGNSVKDLVGAGDTEGERIYSGLEKNYSGVSAGETGWRKHVGDASKFLGMMGAMGGATGIIKGAGLSASAANAVTTASTFYDNEKTNWTLKYPGEPGKANIGALLSTAAYGATQKIFPSSELGDAVAGKMAPEIKAALTKFNEGAVTKELRDGLVNSFKKVLTTTAKGVAGSGEAALHMGAITTFQQTLDQVMGLDEQTARKYGSQTATVDAAKGVFLGSLFPKLLISYGNRNAVADAHFDIASDPERFKSEVGGDKEKLADIDFLANIKQELDKRGINIPNQKRFLLESMQERYIKRNAEESTLAKEADENIALHRAAKERILKGEDVVGEEIRAQLSPEENKVIEAIKSKPELANEKEGSMGRTLYDAAQDPQNHKQIIKELVDQSIDPEALEINVGRRIADAVLELPQKSEQKTAEQLDAEAKTVIENQKNETIPEGTEAGAESNEQAQASEATGPTLTIDEGAEKPPEPPAEVAAAAEPDSENKVGVSQQSLSNMAKKLGLPEPERGTVLTPKEYADRGRMLIEAGAKPYEIANEFKKTGNLSPDIISVARGHLEDLTKALNQAGDKYGEKSPEYKEALAKYTEWRDDVVKPMGTKAGETFTSLQGERDIDTGSFTALRTEKEEAQGGKPLTEKQAKEAQALSSKVASLSKEVEGLKQQLTEALDKAVSGSGKSPKTIKEKADQIAELIRKGKTSRPDTFSAATPASLVWDSALEVMAKTIEGGGAVAQAIADGLAHIKETDWYKGLSEDKKTEAEGAFKDYFNTGDIFTRFTDKKDNKFSPEDAKDIWDYAKINYLDKGADFDQMISGTSVDLGLKPEQVRDALVTPKGTKTITDAMYKKQNQRNMAIQQAKDWATAAKQNPLVKFIKTIPRFFFAAKVFGHGTVGMVTHSGINIYDPVEWKRYWPVFFKQFKFAYGKAADYETAMQDLKNDPQFIFWKRSGLAVDPSERYDEYQFVTKAFNKMGKVGRWLTAGDRGFNALKVYRLERAKGLWNNLSEVEKADKNTPKELAKLVNHSTGTTGLKVSDAAQVVFFAPNLELARWNKLIVDPAKAVKTFTSWNDATPAERAAAKIVAKRAGRILATYVGALAVNQGLLSLSGSNQQINFTDPTKSDWLKFKAGGRTIDLTGGMVSILGFLTKMGHTAFASGKEMKGKSRKDELMNQVWSYGSGKFSPFASTAKDLVTHHDFQGNTLPFYNDKPLNSWNKKLTLGEYLSAQQTPIPVAEAYTDVHKQMEDAGVPKETSMQIMKGILVGAVVGGTGAHVGEEPLPPAKSFKLPEIVENDFDRTEDSQFSAPQSNGKLTIAGNEVTFSGDQEREFKDLITENRQKLLDDYFKDKEDNYKKLPDIGRKGVLKLLYETGRELAVQQMLKKYPELIKQVKGSNEKLREETIQQVEERKTQ